jgi:DNA methylase
MRSLLALELQELNAADFDLSLTGFDPKEIDDLLLDEADDDRANATPPVPEIPVSRAGDLWLCVPHRVLCGDSTSADDVARLLGENSTMWDSPSPKFVMGGSDEEKFDHPTQKPVELMRRPILNHTKRGELIYEPFLGSGTTLAAAELTERVCCGMELDPKYVDVVVQRWEQLAVKTATLEGDGRTLDEIAEERQSDAA